MWPYSVRSTGVLCLASHCSALPFEHKSTWTHIVAGLALRAIVRLGPVHMFGNAELLRDNLIPFIDVINTDIKHTLLHL